MAKEQKIKAKALSAEDRIKEAASLVFQKKGYAGTRTRDIAEAAGLNLALINYYFRSKQNLFDIVMREKVSGFFTTIIPQTLSENISMEKRITMLSEKYIDFLMGNPDLPHFVINTIYTDTKGFTRIIKGFEKIETSGFAEDFRVQYPHIKFEQFMLNFMSLVIFPFIARPAITSVSKSIGKNFNALMEERKELIAKWCMAILKAR